MLDRRVLRILDANLNRAREALRVIEEYGRFHLESAWLTAELKALRHALTAAATRLPLHDLLAARDAEDDVGAGVFAPGQAPRTDVGAVVTAAFKRLQEALRAIEEYGQLGDAAAGVSVQGLRFRAYALEQAVGQMARSRERFASVRLYVLVTEALCRRPWLETIEAVIAGGAEAIQLREKDLSDAEYLSRAAKAQEVCRRAGAVFVVNDRVAVAQVLAADAVHLGQADLPARRVRRLVGETTAIGVSTHSIQQARNAVAAGADYLGVGPMFATATKPHEPVVGLVFAREAAAEIAIPWFALGGVTAENLPELAAVGVTRVAVSAAVIAADDPQAAARQLRARLPA